MKLCVFDVDGTIVPNNEEIHPSVSEAIREFLSDGNIVAIASGRPFTGIEKFFDAIGPSESIYAIASNGAAVYDRHGNLLHLDGLNPSSLREFVERYEKRPNVDCYAYVEPDGICCTRLSYNIEWEYKYNRIHYHIPYDRALKNIDGKRVMKIMIVAPSDISKTLTYSKEDYDRYSIVRSTPEYIELMAKGVDKGTAVEFLKNYLSVARDDVYCFGDAGNDIGMLSRFHGVAMGNGTDEAKEAAEFLTLSCEEDGVAYALRHLLHLI